MARGTEVSGPLFDGRATKAVRDFYEELLDEVAKQGVNDVKAVLSTSLQNPTGRYERGIVTNRQVNDRTVNDSGIVYGPWLEGVSSRNANSRFKGYSAFRKANQELSSKVPRLADMMMRTYLGRMN